MLLEPRELSLELEENRAKNRRVDIAIVRGKEIDEYRTMSLTQAQTEAEPIAEIEEVEPQ